MTKYFLLSAATPRTDVPDEINSFKALSGDERIRKIIEWCDKGDNSKLAIIQHAILYDLDVGVKLAAFKRIHLFAEQG